MIISQDRSFWRQMCWHEFPESSCVFSFKKRNVQPASKLSGALLRQIVPESLLSGYAVYYGIAKHLKMIQIYYISLLKLLLLLKRCGITARQTGTNLLNIRSSHNTTNRPIKLTQPVPNANLPGVKIVCVLYLHYNVAFKCYGNY